MAPWNELLQDKKWQTFFSTPHPIVVSFVEKIKNEGCVSVLDIGCGLGRHTRLLASNGFNVFAIDNSEFAITTTMNKLHTESLSAELKVCDMKELPFEQRYFDAVICFNVLYHTTWEDGLRTVKEIFRVLKKGGHYLLTLISLEDPEYGNGYEIEKNTYIYTQGYESGVIHHFYSEDEVKNIISLFGEGTYECKKVIRAPDNEYGFYWIVSGIKNRNLK